MKSDIVVRHVFFCVLAFWFFSLFSSFVMAAENIPEAIWNLEQKRNQEKTHAEFLGAKIEEGEYDERIEEELAKIEENIQGYNLRISELQERQLKEQEQERQMKEQERVKQAAIISSTGETAYEKQDSNGSSWFGKLVLFVIVGGVIFFLYDNWESLTRKPENITPGVFNQRFSVQQNTPARSENVSPPRQANQGNLRDLVNQGVERLADPDFLRSQDAQDGRSPGRR